MSEQELISKAKNTLTKRAGTAWSGARWTDIFGIFDIIYWNPHEAPSPSYFQVSTKDHRWARLQKIYKFAADHEGKLPAPCYLMLWDYSRRDFEIERIA